jgi:hypothetical protein
MYIKGQVSKTRLLSRLFFRFRENAFMEETTLDCHVAKTRYGIMEMSPGQKQ